jgi:hypothetical protein
MEKNNLIPIKQVDSEVTAETSYHEVEVEINGKSAYANVWFSFDNNVLGESDFGYEILEDMSDELNGEETEAFKEWLNNRRFKLK